MTKGWRAWMEHKDTSQHPPTGVSPAFRQGWLDARQRFKEHPARFAEGYTPPGVTKQSVTRIKVTDETPQQRRIRIMQENISRGAR